MTVEESYEVVKYLSFCEDVSPHHKNALSTLLCAYDRQKEAWGKVKEDVKRECAWDYNCNMHINKILEIIDKHLKEVENEETIKVIN